MKFVILTDENVVRGVYMDVHNPTIYPEGDRIVFSNGKIENIGKNFLLLEDHIPVVVGQQLDDSYKDYDQSDRYVHLDFSEKVEEVVEEIKEFFTDDEKDKKE
jgi:hypothetical protein